MSKAFTAKVFVSKVQPVGDGQTSLGFTAHYQNAEGERINQEWAKYTPGLQLNMTVLDSVAEGIEYGKGYTLTFTPED